MSNKANPLARALARWEWDGGRTDGDYEKLVAREEEHILQCLGAAVIMRWNNPLTDVQRNLFASAVSVNNSVPTGELKEQIARFLHTHKDM